MWHNNDSPVRFRPAAVVTIVVPFFIFVYLFYPRPPSHRVSEFQLSSEQSIASSSDLRVACNGPRGTLLRGANGTTDDYIDQEILAPPFNEPLGGSYDALNLTRTWSTAVGRYGPYGFKQDTEENQRSVVEWPQIQWGVLQDRCLERNRARYPDAPNQVSRPRMKLREDGIFKIWNALRPRDSRYAKGRTAIVLRSWDTYIYQGEDYWNIRSLITETALATGGDYSVFLLVRVEDSERRIFESDFNYQTAMMDLVPLEFWSIAVLYDYNLLKSWYPDVLEWKHEFQAYQPLQLFAQFYPEFDYYWDIEMDVRFTGHAGAYLNSLSKFARNEPRKQSHERARYYYMPAVHGSYSEYVSLVDLSESGKGIWGGIQIPDINPIGPTPPRSKPERDDFKWGVGEEADLIVSNACYDVKDMDNEWTYKHWIYGFHLAEDTPRFGCPSALTRVSWNLLNAVHYAQVHHRKRLQSEATLPSFALWHGLKASFPPQPWFQLEPCDPKDMDRYFNPTGPLANARENNTYEGTCQMDNWPSWWWTGFTPRVIMDMWFENPTEGPLPSIFREEDGQVYLPNMALHPVKTNGEIFEPGDFH
ncbi:MAG: hypothetical protein M1820_001354 [Bogoriella megaspora]|nr:MAG: hypothetical protein M1820_001354 [Bogoriella megaspora]